jgi:magnesium and cobalt transporter
MSGRAGLLARLRALLPGHTPEPTLRESIAELVQEAAAAPQTPGEPQELDRHERILINNILRLRETSADDVMIPRADIIAIRADVTLAQAIEQIRIEGHSRLPVYREQLDDIIGMIHVKDLFAFVGRAEAFSIEAILRRPLMVAPQVPVLDLLAQMRQAHMHMALVVDEYGGIDGLVTIEDLIETITGDISDEHDEAERPMVTERPDGALDVDARLAVEDFEARVGQVLSEDERDADIDTVGGLVFTLAGHVPAKGEVVSHPGGIEFRVLEADARRIRRLRVRRIAQDAAA